MVLKEVQKEIADIIEQLPHPTFDTIYQYFCDMFSEVFNNLKGDHKRVLSNLLALNGCFIKDGFITVVPIPRKEELINEITNWRDSAPHGAIVVINDLETHLTNIYVRPFLSLGYGNLEKFLVDHKFIVMRVNQVVFFNPQKEMKEDGGKQIGKDDNSSDDDDCCNICMEQPRDCVLLTCGHLCMCCGCAANLDTCPICRQKYTKDQTLKVYKT